MKSRKPIDVAASKYGRNYLIATFVAWFFIQELVVAYLYGWNAKGTTKDSLTSGVLLLVGAFFAIYVGRRAEARYKRTRLAATAG